MDNNVQYGSNSAVLTGRILRDKEARLIMEFCLVLFCLREATVRPVHARTYLPATV
ncbi:uncharacterized protein PHALS_01439 [Plasmopara halstedii]|uniref:Uncharacterized protein n=1 Tax=Plasmopara halstedii TaxID=4781 RepID=A0A0P1AWY1_PLAHL|nr:uncharacterized protein PHALS_01439 [Plasmopara halstedii]CEG45117.1 hypothetical protein PHALS_01439 [Plasmopara halstedii]|eukprot:XP_024581486.1 hypothetical protein PHALS_01439 [Plasmopara halstedii]